MFKCGAHHGSHMVVKLHELSRLFPRDLKKDWEYDHGARLQENVPAHFLPWVNPTGVPGGPKKSRSIPSEPLCQSLIWTLVLMEAKIKWMGLYLLVFISLLLSLLWTCSLPDCLSGRPHPLAVPPPAPPSLHFQGEARPSPPAALYISRPDP